MQKKLQLELLWGLLSLIVVIAVLFPIFYKLDHYPFTSINVIFILVFITFTRYVFLLRDTFLASLQYVKIAIILLSPIIIFYLINEINYFQTFMDEEGMDALVGNLAYDERNDMANYIKNELLLFGVGSIVSALFLPLRLVLSVWRGYNRGTI